MTLWICTACGKTSPVREGGHPETSYGWDVSCYVNAEVCDCYRCTKERIPTADPADGLDLETSLSFARMFLCRTCGNKRCPHAADHRLACTGSNEPGQPGSLYEDVPWPPKS